MSVGAETMQAQQCSGWQEKQRHTIFRSCAFLFQRILRADVNELFANVHYMIAYLWTFAIRYEQEQKIINTSTLADRDSFLFCSSATGHVGLGEKSKDPRAWEVPCHY